MQCEHPIVIAEIIPFNCAFISIPLPYLVTSRHRRISDIDRIGRLDSHNTSWALNQELLELESVLVLRRDPFRLLPQAAPIFQILPSYLDEQERGIV